MALDLGTLKKGDTITFRNGEKWEVINVEPSWLTYHTHHISATDPIAYISNHYYSDGSVNGAGKQHPEDIVNIAPS